MTAEILSATCGVILSLIFSYIPGRESWWANLEAAKKRLVMLLLLVLVAVMSFLFACIGWATDIGYTMACNRSGFVGLVTALIYAIMANQSAYQLTKRS
jgi:hypothetical protein